MRRPTTCSPPRGGLAALGLAAALWLTCPCGAALAARDNPAAELPAALAAARAAGCPGASGTRVPLRRLERLDQAAQRAAAGSPANEAAQAAGYRARRFFTVNMSGQASAPAVAQTMASHYCKELTDPRMSEFGFHHAGGAWWLVLAEPLRYPDESAAGAVAARVLALANQARSQPRRCGSQPFAAAAPLKPSTALDRAAAAQARDMANHGALRHEGSDGSSPSERASRAGYRWQDVGENIAAGQTSADEVVLDWTRSPEHCANLMNPQFSDMGIAFAVNQRSRQGIYWAQVLGHSR